MNGGQNVVEKDHTANVQCYGFTMRDDIVSKGGFRKDKDKEKEESRRENVRESECALRQWIVLSQSYKLLTHNTNTDTSHTIHETRYDTIHDT